MKKIFKIQIGLMMLAGVAASCSDEMTFSPGGLGEDNGSRSKATLGLDFNVNQPGFRTRANSEDVKTLWIGAYDIQTGERVGFKFHDDVNTGKATVQVVYFDSHPDVVIVGVANSKGYTGKNSSGETVLLDTLLANAEKWGDLKNINVNFDEGLDPLMMGFVGTTAFNNPIIKDDPTKTQVVNIFDYKKDNSGQKAFVNNTGNYRVKIMGDADLNDSNFNVTINSNAGTLQLVPLVSTVDVKVIPGSGIEVSNISYKAGNIPTKGYLAERELITDEPSTESDYFSVTPNYSDLSGISGFYSSADWIPVSGNTFSYTQHENKHWGYHYDKTETSLETFYRREELVRNGGSSSGLLMSLCGNNGEDFNNNASYFVVKMNVKNRNGESAVVEYTVHAGNANNEHGDERTNNTQPEDFSCFRNMHYTYNLTINGINKIILNVERENGVYHDGIAGTVWKIESNKAEIGETYTIEADENTFYRLYVGPANFDDKIARDYVSDTELAESLGYNWPEVLANATLEEISKYINWTEDASGNKQFSIKEGETKKVEFPEEYLIAIYYHNPSDTKVDQVDGTCQIASMKQYSYQPTPKERLIIPSSFVKEYTAKDFITKEIEIPVDEISGVDSDAYKYVLSINGNESAIEFTKGSESTKGSFVIPINELNPAVSASVENNFSIYAKAQSDEYWDSEPVKGTITLTQPDWNFNSKIWQTEFESSNWYKDSNFYVLAEDFITRDDLTINKGGQIIRGYVNSKLNLNNAGGRDLCHLKFTIYRDCRITYYADGNNDGAGRQIVVDGGNEEIKRGTLGASKPEKPETIYLYADKEGTDIYVYNAKGTGGGAGINIYRLQLKAQE